jgi:hypothetical protein
MFDKIISTIIAHKAGIMLGAAAAGVVATAIVAVKDSKKHEDALNRKECELLEVMSDDEYTEYCEDETLEQWDIIEKKDKAIIFAKSYWRTGLCMAVTFGLMILSHRTMVKELAATAAALGLMSTKYKDIQSYLKENYPEQYEQMMKKLNRKNARKAISEKPFNKEETYDGRKRYYFPLSDQLVFMKPEDFVKIQAFLSSTIGSTMQCTLNEVLDYIHYDLGYKDVHISDIDYIWEFPADECVEDTSFPAIEFEYDDVLDDNTMVVCQVVRTNIEPEVRHIKEVV